MIVYAGGSFATCYISVGRATGYASSLRIGWQNL